MKEVTRRFRAITDNSIKHLLVVLIWNVRAASAVFNGVYPIPGAGREIKENEGYQRLSR